MTTLRLAVAEAPEESVTLMVKLKVPAAVGVPARIPRLVRVSPPGNAPADTVQAYPAPVPPVAVSVAEYDTLIVPPGRDVAVTFNGIGLEEGESEDPPPQP
jgi:hypothetical protein